MPWIISEDFRVITQMFVPQFLYFLFTSSLVSFCLFAQKNGALDDILKKKITQADCDIVGVGSDCQTIVEMILSIEVRQQGFLLPMND